MNDTEYQSELPTGPAEPLARAEIGLVTVSLVLGIVLLVVLAFTLPKSPTQENPAPKAPIPSPK